MLLAEGTTLSMSRLARTNGQPVDLRVLLDPSGRVGEGVAGGLDEEFRRHASRTSCTYR
jgi:hypothetical protein